MTQTVDAAIAAFRPELPMVVAFSGGADSTAVLRSCALRWPGAVRAIHIHHGLQAAADAFEAHCRRCCADWAVPLQVRRVDAWPRAGESPEAAAREARYQALTDGALAADDRGRPAASVVLGHHADDQVETFLLALLRGAGVHGLAAMPARQRRDGLWWERPLLEVPRPAIEDWLSERGIDWIVDPSNADPRYTRNRIRREVLPALSTVAPGWRDTLGRSIAHLAQARAVLDSVAQEDRQRTGWPPALGALRLLDTDRRINVLRTWLREVAGRSGSAAQIRELDRQIVAARTRGHDIRLRIAGGWVERRGDLLAWQPALPGEKAPPGTTA